MPQHQRLFALMTVACTLGLAGCGGEDGADFEPATLDGDLGQSSVGSEGGVVSTESGQAAVVIPPGAIDDGSIQISITDVGTDGFPESDSLFSSVYELGPDGTQFDIPVTVSLALPADLYPGVEPAVATLDETTHTWVPLTGSFKSGNRVLSQTRHFSYYAVVVPPIPMQPCYDMWNSGEWGDQHPLTVPNTVLVTDATKLDALPGGFSGPNPLELGGTWEAHARNVTVTGYAGLPGTGGWIDWSTQSGGTMNVDCQGVFTLELDVRSHGPYLGLTDACLAPSATEHSGWIYALNVHCGQGCWDDPSPPVASGSNGAASCGPKQLCMRTINACGINMTQQDCENWYQTPSNCADMAAYTACNCNCYCAGTCNDYFDCGQACFNQHC